MVLHDASRLPLDLRKDRRAFQCCRLQPQQTANTQLLAQPLERPRALTPPAGHPRRRRAARSRAAPSCRGAGSGRSDRPCGRATICARRSTARCCEASGSRTPTSPASTCTASSPRRSSASIIRIRTGWPIASIVWPTRSATSLERGRDIMKPLPPSVLARGRNRTRLERAPRARSRTRPSAATMLRARYVLETKGSVPRVKIATPSERG